MEVKENRPDACAASGTANSIYKDFSTDAPDIQEELTGPVLPDDCAADIVSFCSEQTIAYDDLLEYAALFYLQDVDPEDPPSRDRRRHFRYWRYSHRDLSDRPQRGIHRDKPQTRHLHLPGTRR